MAARNELNIAPITQILKLLTYLRPDVLVAGIEIAKMALERIDFFQGEITLAERLDALHHVKQPTARFERLASEGKASSAIPQEPNPWAERRHP